METFESKINYKFKNRDYLLQALTHSSFANEKHNEIECNERLEFLGDSVLSLITSQFLFDSFPYMPEGELSKLRSSLVCTDSLSGIARKINLGDYLFLGKGETVSGGAEKQSILEDAFESVVAAVYLDGGLEEARKFVLRFLAPMLKEHNIAFFDYKTTLQEIVQQYNDQKLSYSHIGESGPPHNRRFEAVVKLNSNVIGKGIGTSKKSAEQAAAREALKLMGVDK